MIDFEIFIVADTLAAIILAVGFLAAYLYDRRLVALRWWMWFFALVAVSLATTVLDPSGDVVWRKMATWSSLFGAVVIGTLAMHREGSIPTRPYIEIIAGTILLFGAGIVLVALDAPHTSWVAIGPIPTLIVTLGAAWRVLARTGLPLIDVITAAALIVAAALLGMRSYWMITLENSVRAKLFDNLPHFTVPPNAIGPMDLAVPVEIEKPLIVALLTILVLLAIAVSAFLRAALDAMRSVREHSAIDSLSGLLNRGGFDEAAELTIQAAGRRSIAVATFDIDHFKRVNDTGGHACGDRVIAGLGSIIRDAIADGQIAGRIGGEEFAVLIPGGHISAARLLAEAVRTRLSASDFGPEIPWQVTLSGGVAERMENEPLHLLMARADKALYQAKQSGRDRIALAATPDRAPAKMALAQTQHG